MCGNVLDPPCSTWIPIPFAESDVAQQRLPYGWSHVFGAKVIARDMAASFFALPALAGHQRLHILLVFWVSV